MKKQTNMFCQENPLIDQSPVRENQAEFKHPVFLRILRPETCDNICWPLKIIVQDTPIFPHHN